MNFKCTWSPKSTGAIYSPWIPGLNGVDSTYRLNLRSSFRYCMHQIIQGGKLSRIFANCKCFTIENFPWILAPSTNYTKHGTTWSEVLNCESFPYILSFSDEPQKFSPSNDLMYTVIVIRTKFKAEKLFQYIMYRFTCAQPPFSEKLYALLLMLTFHNSVARTLSWQ